MLTAAQQVEWNKIRQPITPSGEQTQAQAENLAISSFQRICELEGLWPSPSREDIRTALETSKKLCGGFKLLLLDLRGRVMRCPEAGQLESRMFWHEGKWNPGPLPSEDELSRYTRCQNPELA